jgi:20S proteasome alpha/beta subunit
MTQIVGIVCKDTIVIASESQYTVDTGGTNWKQFEKHKIDSFIFKDGNQGIVAFAGAVKPALRVIDLMKSIASQNTSDNEMAGVNIAKGAIIKYRQEVMDFYQKSSNMPVEEQDKIFGTNDRYFQLLVGHAFGIKRADRIPCLFSIDVSAGQAERIEDYVVTGSGSQLATFMLKQFDCKEMEWAGAISLAIDAVDRIKESDLYCGGPIRVGMLNTNMFERVRVGFWRPEDTERVVEKLKKMRAENAAWQKAKFSEVMKEIHEENYVKIMREMKAKEEQENQWRAAAAKNNPVTVVNLPENKGEVK